MLQYELTVEGSPDPERFDADHHEVEGSNLVFRDAVGRVVKSVERRRVAELSSLEVIPPISEPEPWGVP